MGHVRLNQIILNDEAYSSYYVPFLYTFLVTEANSRKAVISLLRFLWQLLWKGCYV